MGDGQGETISISAELSLTEAMPYTSLKQKTINNLSLSAEISS